MTAPDLGSRVACPARPGFTLDLGRCVGCGSCVLGCRIENRLPKGVSWRKVLQVNRPRIGGGPSYHLSVACHHCQNPPCARACPSGALEKRPNGLVRLETGRCIGCRYCEMACPFGAPSFDKAAGVMTKCNLCQDRLSGGSAPACVAACPTGALGFSPPVAEKSEPLEGEGKGRTFGPAVDVPGFGDPAEADPGFWVADPAGAIRSRWFRDLKALLGAGGEELHDPT
jgi:anaerobic dimethyl sulfoxide reductase subunit B (iron-sulfur subunit)